MRSTQLVKSTLSLVVICSLLTACEQKTTFAARNSNPYQSLFQSKGRQTSAKLPYKTVAKVNIDVINTTLLTLYESSKKNADPTQKNQRAESVNELINLIILAQKAQQEGFHYNNLIKERIRFQRLSLLAGLYLEKLNAQVTISDKELRSAYQKRYFQKQNYEYKTRHIVVKKRKQAIELLRQLAKGKKFNALAKKHSKGPSADFGGALEWFRPENVGKVFAKAVSKLAEGEVSRLPVKTKHGWHIIMLEQSRRVTAPTFKDISAKLYNDIKKEKMEVLLKMLRSKSNIVIGN